MVSFVNCKTVAGLPDADFRQLFLAVAAYAENGTLITLKSPLDVMFQFFKADIDDKQAKYEGTCEKRSEFAKGRERGEDGRFGANPQEPQAPQEPQNPQAPPIDREIDIKDIKTYSPSERAEESPPMPPGGDIPATDAPAAMREAVELFLAKTGRGGITPEELGAVSALEEIHSPLRVMKEITSQLAKFAKRGKPPGELTLAYVFEVLKCQPPTSPKARQPKPQPWPYTLTYEQVAGLWDSAMVKGGFARAPDNDPVWKKHLADRIAVNPAKRDSLDWWRNVFREIYGSDFASGEKPCSDGTVWRLELSILLKNEDKLQNAITGVYRNKETAQDMPVFVEITGTDGDSAWA
jgi:hypothetical protein